MIKTERDIFVKCEYLENPLGIQNRFPRFSWMVSSKWSNTIQTGYQITVRDQNGRQVWNSGKRKSQDCSAVEYEGEALRSKGIYEWDVTVNLEFCDGKHGNKTLTGGGTFEMGLLSQVCAPIQRIQRAALLQCEIVTDIHPAEKGDDGEHREKQNTGEQIPSGENEPDDTL